jgi:HEAT repeat protein
MRHINRVLILAVVALIAAMAVQHQSTRRLASEVSSLRQELAPATPQELPAPNQSSRERVTQPNNAAILHRLDALEQTVAQLGRNSDYLMERGQLPLATNKLSDLLAKLTDTGANDRERLQALRLLRRNGGLTDETLLHALNWLQGATNANTREDILQQLEGVTNAALRGPLMALATDPDPDVREQAVDNLRRFIGDPLVEGQLWQMLNDPDEDVRDQAMDAIVEGPKSEARIAALQERASDPNNSLEERLLAWRALRESQRGAADISAALAQMAQQTQDPFQRAKLFAAFDDAIEQATSSDAAFLPPLVQGLQDPSPLVRERAADALNDFSADPTVQQWLRYAAENDPDPAVRRQAARRIINSGR